MGRTLPLLLCLACADATDLGTPDAAPEPPVDAFVLPDGPAPDVAEPDAAPPDAAPPNPDLDDDGTPNEDDCAPRDPNRHPGAFEQCNGLDDDCDGEVDEGLSRVCYDGPEETRMLGTCADGMQACVGGEWGACEGQVLPTEEVCDQRDTDCDGAIDEGLGFTWPDQDGDGHGDMFANGTCEDAAGRVPVGDDCDDGDPDVFPGAADEPEPTFADTNCDGVDGTAANLFFVDDDADPETALGTRDAPFASLRAAVEAASGREDIAAIAVSEGTYDGGLRLRDGLSIYGGYTDGTWDRGPAPTAVITTEISEGGQMVAVRAVDIVNPTLLARVTITTADHPEPGGNTYGLVADNAPALTLRAVEIRPGAGGEGASGEDGLRGPDGGGGQAGGSCGGRPGAGGESACGASGGEGGMGGSRGNRGEDGDFPGCGGRGGDAGGAGAGADGGHGCNAPDSPPGMQGVTRAAGPGEDALWSRPDGEAGADGAHGAPGGGGGGGGGAAVIGGTAGAGGGGGAGGCGGQGGGGGTGGGASLGLYLVRSTGLTVEAGHIETAGGGAGGDGGRGGPGGSAGDGAGGGSGREAFACGGLAGPGWGGSGGRGGRGGDGGHGAGGGGGSSHPVVCVETAIAIGQETILRPGPAGAAGGGPGEAGAAGLNTARFGCE